MKIFRLIFLIIFISLSQPALSRAMDNVDTIAGQAQGGDHKALIKLERMANSGDGNAQFKLGEMYLNGHGVDKNSARADYWFKRSEKSFSHGEASNQRKQKGNVYIFNDETEYGSYSSSGCHGADHDLKFSCVSQDEYNYICEKTKNLTNYSVNSIDNAMSFEFGINEPYTDLIRNGGFSINSIDLNDNNQCVVSITVSGILNSNSYNKVFKLIVSTFVTDGSDGVVFGFNSTDNPWIYPNQ